MNKRSYHLPILVIALIFIGLSFSFYEYYVLGIPVNPDRNEKVWTVEAGIAFRAKTGKPVKVECFIPNIKGEFINLNESFISRNYGINIKSDKDNRKAIWSIRHTRGEQKLYYRVSLLKSRLANTHTSNPNISTSVAPTDEFAGAELTAAEALIAPIRTKSADIATFTAEAIKALNTAGSNAQVLLDGDTSPLKTAKIAVKLLSLAKIHAQIVHGIYMEPAIHARLHIWLRSYNGKEWLYFDPVTGKSGLPDDVLIWWHGDEPLLSLDGGTHGEFSLSVKPAELSAIQLATQAGNIAKAAAIKFSLLSLPIQTQHLYKILVMVPIGVFIILLLRCFIGIPTFGTFMPVLIAMAFRETQLLWGIFLFVLVISMGLGIRAYLDQLKLLLVPRLSVILCAVVIFMGVISILAHQLGIEHGLSVALFPMVILTMTIERMSIVLEERGGGEAFKTGGGSLFSATLAYLAMSNAWLSHIVFVFPGIILVIMALMLLLGRYRGYRISELFRFKEFLTLQAKDP